jgi:hypothetical protein
MELNAPVGGGPRWGGYEFAAGTLRTLLPLVERFGIATAEEMVESGGAGKPLEMVSAWAPSP